MLKIKSLISTDIFKERLGKWPILNWVIGLKPNSRWSKFWQPSIPCYTLLPYLCVCVLYMWNCLLFRIFFFALSTVSQFMNPNVDDGRIFILITKARLLLWRDVPSLNYLNWLRISVCKRKFLRMSGNRGFILLVKELLFWPFLTCENLPSVTVKEKKESQFVAELNTNVFTQTLEGCNYRVNLTFSISRVSITNFRQ